LNNHQNQTGSVWPRRSNEARKRPIGAPSVAKLLTKADALLAARYGTPRLGNKRDPVSELVFIILSARTRGKEHEATYRKLRCAFPTWTALRDAPTRKIESVIRDAGLAKIKARQLKGLLRRITDDFGALGGKALRRIDNPALEAYLTSLPGVGLKTARCVLLYSFDEPVFPVDTHCLRLFNNLGLIDGRPRFEYAQNPLQALVPPRIRYSLHVNAVAHGRQTCIPGSPRCAGCPIAAMCRHRRPAA
jgi:endonuclease III